MITPELIGYIRSEFAKGKTREKIRAVLVADGGWSEADLSEAFRTVIPMQGFIAPKTKLPLSLWKICLTFVVIGGFCFAVWYFYRAPVISMWNSLVKNITELSIPKLSIPYFDTKKTNNVKNTTAQNNTAAVQNNTPIKQPEVVIKDCGIGIAPDLKNPRTYQNDAVLTCLGNSALGCEDAKAVLKNALFPTIFQIARESIRGQNTCNFRLSYGKDNTLIDVVGKKLAGQSISCPISLVKALDESSPKTSLFKAPSQDNPSKYASQIYFYGTIGLFIENAIDKNKIRALGCEGEYIDSVVESYGKMQSKK